MTRTVKTLATTATLATTLLVSACSSDGRMGSHDMPAGPMTGMGTARTGATASPTDGSATAHNQADITFAASMVPHHQQAIEMADLALAQADSPEVRELARRIEAAQDPEITTMTGWLTDWGSAPMPSDHDMGAMGGMGGMGGDGMMTAQEMVALKQASGTAFDRMWLQMMIRHHEGAVDMARTELALGQSAQAKTLAQAVIDGQSTEITTMKGLLDTSS